MGARDVASTARHRLSSLVVDDGDVAADLLRAHDMQLETVLQLTPFMITRCSRDLKYEFVSDAYAAMLGVTVQQIEGRAIVEVIGEEGFAAIRPHIDRVLSGEVVHYEAPVHFDTAGTRHLSVTYTPERDATGTIVGWIASVLDATERRGLDREVARLNEQLRDADRRKDEFLAILAHELRNPLGTIHSVLELLRMNGDPAPTLRQVRPIMERQVAHMVRLVDDLLDVSRIVTGRLELRRQPSVLRDLIEAALDETRAMFERSSLTLKVQLPSDECVLDVDPTRFVQILSNVLHNAAKFTPAGGAIDVVAIIESAVDAPTLVLTVRDTGEGIAASKLARVFELFEQSSPADAEKGGLGIGLALARRLTELHGGTITAHSDGPGQGSSITIRVPIAAIPLPAASSDDAAAPRISRRVLVIDDNRDAADALALLVSSMGGHAQVAESGIDGLESARQFQPDIIFIDIGMPGMDGYETCRRLRLQSCARRPYLAALTGWGQDRDRRRAIDAGFDVHLTKPADLNVLQALLSGEHQ